MGVQTRSMADAQGTEEETPNQLETQQVQMNRDNFIITPDHPTPNLDQQNAALNPTVELTKMNDENMEAKLSNYS